MNYYNTNGERGKELKASEKRASSQNMAVMRLFQSKPKKGRTALNVYLNLSVNSPESSYRRACHTLCKNGLLKETGEMVTDIYRKPNRVYLITKKGLKLKTK